MKSLLLSILLLCCISMAAQWDRQNPYNHIGIINDIIVNDSYGAAVGDDATIFLSSDGGSSWEIKDNDLNGWNFSTVERNDDLIYACGKGIYKSVDGGGTFEEIPDTPRDIFDSYLSESGILIIANKEGVYKSIDQGTTFTNLNTPTDSLGNYSFIHDENYIWWTTAGLSPTLYITSDGGDTWETNNELVRPEHITFYDKDNGVAKSFGSLHYTVDGGQTWEERVQMSRILGKIVFGESPNNGYITGRGSLFTTIDGFNTVTEYKRLIT